jgi:hypothetical protein
MSGIVEQEYITMYVYLVRLLETIPRVKGDTSSTPVKKLKQLKERDPVLYEFKKIHNSNTVYSKLCQKQKQPIMYDTPGRQRVKFWNFTTNEPVYYGCPDPKYPHVNFITHGHPKGYCIPCCYKLPPSTGNDKKSKIYKTCMTDKKYEKEKKSLVTSRYVMSYGKAIEVGRLTRLPEHSLEPLLHGTFSKGEHGVDEECSREKGYYVFGVPQHMKNISNVGFLFCVAHAVGENIIRFVEKTISKILDDSSAWKTLLDGKVTRHFTDVQDLTDTMYAVLIKRGTCEFTQWNELFIDISRVYWETAVIHFADSAYGDGQPSIGLHIPGYVRHWEDYMFSGKHLIVVSRNNRYYPIYVVYKDTFFKVGTMESKLYDENTPVVKQVYEMVRSHTTNKFFTDTIDLNTVKSFVVHSKYNITAQYINASNQCYGVSVAYISKKKPFVSRKNKESPVYIDMLDEYIEQNRTVKGKSFFIPVDESHHVTDGTPCIFSPPPKKLYPSWKTVKQYMETFNEFSKKSDGLFPLMVIDNWMLLKPPRSENETVIGFKMRRLNVMLESMGVSNAKRIKQVPMIRHVYDPYIINRAIHENQPPVVDARSKQIASCTYNKYLYQLLIIEFVNYMGKKRNTKIRNALTSIVKTFKWSDLKKVYELLKDYPDDYRSIYRLINDNLSPQKMSQSAASKQMFGRKNVFTRVHINELIDKSIFAFDSSAMDKIKLLPKDDLVSELLTSLKKITTNGTPKFSDGFPNTMSTCSAGGAYCKNGKLLVKPAVLKTMADIMARDILNPFKSKYITSALYIDNTVDIFTFTQRLNEHIVVHI